MHYWFHTFSVFQLNPLQYTVVHYSITLLLITVLSASCLKALASARALRLCLLHVHRIFPKYRLNSPSAASEKDVKKLCSAI